jgi:CRISPR-associated protein Csh2
VTDVRLKRFVRDWLKAQGEQILVDRPEDAATNLAGRLRHFLDPKNTPESVKDLAENYRNLAKDLANNKDEAGRTVVRIILQSFIDARLFGSSLAFKDWDIKAHPKTLTGAVQMNIGEVLNRADEVDIAGTSIFGSSEEKTQGTFTTFYGLRYALIAFNGVANEHSAGQSSLTDADYERFLHALWKSVGGAPTANTRSKTGQIPRLLLDVTYKPKSEFQFGRLMEYVDLDRHEGLASPKDYTLDMSRIVERLKACLHVEKVRCAAHPDLKTNPAKLPWQAGQVDGQRAAPDDPANQTVDGQRFWEKFDPDAAIDAVQAQGT